MRTHWTRRTQAGLAALIALAGAAGCVERRYTIRSDPPGALVVVNGEEKGVTPVSSSYAFYGKRSVRLQHEGYQTLDLVQNFEPPWYDNVLTEFFTENLIPYTFRDERTFVYKLKPDEPTDENKLMKAAESLRAEGRAIPPPRRGGILGYFGFD